MFKNKLIEEEKQREDVGFGTKTTKNIRLVKENGDFNVKKTGQSLSAKLNIYHNLLTMPTYFLTLVVFFYYLTANFIFASIYYLIGTDKLLGINNHLGMNNFWEAFFFSVQTITTLGYGRISPIGFSTNIVASFEALIGLVTFSIITGVVYGRFSKPSPKIVYSENAIISPYLGIKALMIRTANEKNNQLINVSANIIFSKNEIQNGETKRIYKNLELERKLITYFSLSWTIVHPITENSPLWKETEESLKKSDAEFLLSIQAINDTNGETIYSKKSFLFSELLWDYKFAPIIDTEDNYYLMNLEKIGTVEKVNPN
jgi:inward rectifier potassium channel